MMHCWRVFLGAMSISHLFGVALLGATRTELYEMHCLGFFEEPSAHISCDGEVIPRRLW